MPHSIHNPLAFRPAPGSLAGPLAGGAFLLVVALGVMGIPLLVANDRPVEPGLIGVVACLALFLGGLAGSLFYLAYRLRNSLVLLGDEGLVVRADQGWLWGFRRLVEARLAWSDVLGITARGFFNRLAPGGYETKYQLHTTQGTFYLRDYWWTDAPRFIPIICERSGRKLGDMPR